MKEMTHVDAKTVLRKTKEKKKSVEDLHVVRFYSSYVTISEGKVIEVTEPNMTFCPLANFLYRNTGLSGNTEEIAQAIERAVSKKIALFGHFTQKRELFEDSIAVPYGASEMMMYALKKKSIEAAVVVCEGAGTVIASKPEIVQGIGARMNGLFFTSPIEKTQRDLEEARCHVVCQDASINQIEGVRKAAQLGYNNIVVTINCSMDEPFKKTREIEKEYGVSVVVLAICTTGITEKRIKEIEQYADLVWSCGSGALREIIGKSAVLQLSKKIPVFVMTKKGLGFASQYCSHEALIEKLDVKKQYFITSKNGDKKITMGNFDAYLYERSLPVRDKKEPVVHE
jgi:putative methanogenesis marker protein 8